MMGIISDIHGNYEALKAVLDCLEKRSITEIYCLGDVVGYYSQVNECCQELRERNVKCLLGNHDWYLVSGGSCPRSRSANDCLKYQRKVITSENAWWLEKLPVCRKREHIFMVHGGWNNPIDEYVTPDEEYFQELPFHFFFTGHTHVQLRKEIGGKLYCNPGSVGQPRDLDSRAAFAVFDGTDIELFRVEYDIQKVETLMENAGFNGYYYECLEVGARTLGYYRDSR